MADTPRVRSKKAVAMLLEKLPDARFQEALRDLAAKEQSGSMDGKEGRLNLGEAVALQKVCGQIKELRRGLLWLEENL